ncbi:glycosyltransferase family A protein [Butyrivibrio sp. YAB3001]|uniref:glycosyltransferase family A protein n=1 Tax=Butyrivibrio sp. YAB3001 TaxID=1520812 RepID=UPI0008F68582|nr:glycosyltransferase family A protein [Butyrivibrio sp. YAB3001]SFC17418.1 Glycosyl transferase family 2 [Butyrivibrio sp. YAB3001]
MGLSNERLQILISAVDKDACFLPKIMKIESDAIIVDQLIREAYNAENQMVLSEKECNANDLDSRKIANENRDEEIEYNGNKVTILYRREKGVGLSRNTALDRADHEIIQFGDDDIVYDAGYGKKILAEFDAHPEADILLFNVKAQEGRETYWNEDYARVTWKNYGRYPAYAICGRLDKIRKSGVRYSLLFGGGAPYMNGEDSLFLHDCLKAGLSVYRTDVPIGHERAGESTWFKGYTDKFFFDRGVLYHFLYGKLAYALGFRFLYKNRVEMCAEKGLFKCFGLLARGVKHGKTIKKV